MKNNEKKKGMRKQITGQSLADNLKKWINLIKHSKFTFGCLQLLVKKKISGTNSLWYQAEMNGFMLCSEDISKNKKLLFITSQNKCGFLLSRLGLLLPRQK